MPISAYVLLGIVALISSVTAHRLARAQGLNARRWIAAVVLFGPLVLIPLVILAFRGRA